MSLVPLSYVITNRMNTRLTSRTGNLETVFTHGFTTKETGHGFGLHSCANYMAEMGGRMWVESGGGGQGATFVLSFPLTKPSDAEVTRVDEQVVNEVNDVEYGSEKRS